MRLFTTRRKRDYSPLLGAYGPTVFKRVKHTGDGVSPRTALQGKRAAAGAVDAPPKKKGRGLHNPYLTLRTRHQLWEDAVPVVCPVASALQSQRGALRVIGRDVPPWVVITEHGLFCSCCMAAAGKAAAGPMATGPKAISINAPCTNANVRAALQYHEHGRPPSRGGAGGGGAPDQAEGANAPARRGSARKEPVHGGWCAAAARA